MSKVATLAIASMLAFGFAGIGMAQTVTGDDQGVTVTVKGETCRHLRSAEKMTR